MQTSLTTNVTFLFVGGLSQHSHIDLMALKSTFYRLECHHNSCSQNSARCLNLSVHTSWQIHAPKPNQDIDVFDFGNRCGIGKRSQPSSGELEILIATNPFFRSAHRSFLSAHVALGWSLRSIGNSKHGLAEIMVFSTSPNSPYITRMAGGPNHQNRSTPKNHKHTWWLAYTCACWSLPQPEPMTR